MTEPLVNIEFEVKFKVDGSLVYAFKKLVQSLPDLKKFTYVESDDIYYVKDDQFIRHRFDIKDLSGRQEMTFKRKLNQLNNIYRKENNVRCDGNSIDTIASFANSLGFDKNFTISKWVNIYEFPDATLPFYTVIDENGQMTHFIEIEVNEELLKQLTVDQAWEIITKYEKLLAPLGISPQKRLKKSLFEMYRKD